MYKKFDTRKSVDIVSYLFHSESTGAKRRKREIEKVLCEIGEYPLSSKTSSKRRIPLKWEKI